MKGSIILTLVVAGIAAYGPASAEEVAPGDVKFEDMKVMASLTGVPGDPEAGRAAMVNRGQGNCLACHAVTALEAELFHGDVAPPLDGVRGRRPELAAPMKPPAIAPMVVVTANPGGPSAVYRIR